jgi:acetylcholinesterase
VNVFAPTNATVDSNLPVWLYIQGGGYQTNSNANYNGTEVIQQSGGNIVFVTFNYRVGIFSDGDLNVGLLDQRRLLQWVQTYIREVSRLPNLKDSHLHLSSLVVTQITS